MRGKFLYAGDEKLYVRGVTYGTFAPNEAGDDFPEPDVVDADFAAMASNGINAVRTYTVPPRWLLDTALRHGLRVMVGVPWEQHIAFLDDAERQSSIEERVRVGVRRCSGHRAVLCYAIGNEIPASIVRWHGRRRVERFLERLYRAAKAEDPDGLVTYVNYPSTEYLQLPFLDFVCFNVYLESRERLDAYLARLHNLAGDQPLVLAEIGLDSRRNGVPAQARSLEEQVRTVFAAGCAGAFVFAWTDTWFRGGFEIEDWDFGLTDRNREPKPALGAVRDAFAGIPFPPDRLAPLISVIVCCYNCEATLAECLEGLQGLEYAPYEVIVVDDGSTDRTAEIAREHGVEPIMTENRGLASARNTGLEAATGELLVYIDGDASPDPHWLHYLTETFATSDHAAVGGPNIAPPDGWIAECVAHAPGGPMHVMLSDHEAEHIPGCNMTFRRDALEAIGGFDPQFRAAGDDVDVCWRLQQGGWTLGFSAAAVVWHRRRDSVLAYWRQQVGYGKAEALLERKWPEKYNATGHVAWTGRLYGNGVAKLLLGRRWRIYYGTWGTGLFQPAHPTPGTLRWLPLMPEWYVLLVFLAEVSALGAVWPPLLLALPLLLLGLAATLAQATIGAAHARFQQPPRSRLRRLRLRALVAGLFLLQPLARLWGRVRYGLHPWRRRSVAGLAAPRPRTVATWSETWYSPEERLGAVEAAVRDTGTSIRRGGPYDRWDFDVRGGLLGAVRVRMAIEEHGAGRQLARFRLWPRWSWRGLVLLLAPAGVTAAAVDADEHLILIIFGVLTLILLLRALQESAWTMALLLSTVSGSLAESPPRAAKDELLPRERTLYQQLLRQARTLAHGEGANGSGPKTDK